MADMFQIEKQIQNLNFSKEVLRQRIQKLEEIRTEKTLSENIRQCNRYINNCVSHAENGIRGIVTSIPQDLASGQESFDSSYNLQTIAYNINREITRCRQQLSNLNVQIQEKNLQLREARKMAMEEQENELEK